MATLVSFIHRLTDYDLFFSTVCWHRWWERDEVTHGRPSRHTWEPSYTVGGHYGSLWKLTSGDIQHEG